MCLPQPGPPERPLAKVFGPFEDPRCPINRRHSLSEMVVIAIAGVLAGADGWKDIRVFVRAKEQWLRPLLTLPDGIPSHDIFGRMFSLLDASGIRSLSRPAGMGDLQTP